MSNVDKIISLNITQFPQNLLISDIDNEIKIQVVNHSSKKETFKLEFEGENLNIVLEPEEFRDHIEFGPGKTKTIDLKLIPTVNGYGKLTINVNWLKIIQFKVKVQKVRDAVPNSKIQKILDRHYLQITQKIEPFDPDNYFIGMTQDVIKKAEKQLKTLREEFETAQSMGSPTSQLLEKIDSYIIQLAKGYLSINSPLKALEFALMLSNKTEQINLYTNLLRAYASKDFNQVVQITTNLHDLDIQQKILKKLALDQVLINPEQAINTGLLIQKPSIKEDLLIIIFSKVIESNPSLAQNLVSQIDNKLLKTKVLFNVARKLHAQNSTLVNIFKSIIHTILQSYLDNLDNKKVKKESYELLKDSICIFAEIENPSSANSIIESITVNDLKEKLAKDLFDVIYEIVDEIQTKIEATPVFSQYFLLNSYVSKITTDIKNFSLSGGNVSNNILANDFNFNIVLLSLFGFEFSVFPIIDRVYNDLKYSLKKSFAYYIFPSPENYTEKELRTLNSSLKQFFNNLNSAPGQTIVFNLDFIPYLGKPTIIISSDQESNDRIYKKIKKIGETVNIIVDDSVFKGGKISEELINIFPTNKAKIVNLILSYEFINDYDLFKNFIQSLL